MKYKVNVTDSSGRGFNSTSPGMEFKMLMFLWGNLETRDLHSY